LKHYETNFVYKNKNRIKIKQILINKTNFELL